MIRSAIEVAPVHAQRLEDVLVDIDLVRVAAQLFDDSSEEHDAGIRIGESRARWEQQFGVGKHRHELLPPGRLVRLPRLVSAPWPRRGAESGAVRHQVADGHLADVAERIVDGAQFGDVTDDGVVERQAPAIAQLHDRDAGERLRDGRPVEDGLLVDRLLRVEVLQPVPGAGDRSAVVHDPQAAADDSGLLQSGRVEAREALPAFLEGVGECRGLAHGSRS